MPGLTNFTLLLLMLRNHLGPYWVIHGHHYGLHEHASNRLPLQIVSVPTVGSTWPLQEGLQAHFSAWCCLPDASRSSWYGLQVGQTWGIQPSLLFLHSTVYAAKGPLSLSYLTNHIPFQNQIHLQFQHYLEQKGCCVLSLQVHLLHLLQTFSGKMDCLKMQRLVRVFPQTPGASNLPVFDFLSSAGTGIHLGDHFTRSISLTDWRGLVLVLPSTGKVSGRAQPCNFSPSQYFPYILNFNNLGVAGVQVY